MDPTEILANILKTRQEQKEIEEQETALREANYDLKNSLRDQIAAMLGLVSGETKLKKDLDVATFREVSEWNWIPGGKAEVPMVLVEKDGKYFYFTGWDKA